MGFKEEIIEIYKNLVLDANKIDLAIMHTEAGIKEGGCFVPLVDPERLKQLRHVMVLQILAIEAIFINDFGVDVHQVLDSKNREE